MKENNLDKWFDIQQGCWDLAEPETGHESRFLNKLSAVNKKKPAIRVLDWWKPLSIAASIALIVFIGFSLGNQKTGKELATISPEMEKTQDFFTMAIEEELYAIEAERSPETQKIVDDALVQLSILETDYEKLKEDLAKSGEDKRVIYAMITNFQTRIDLLKDVMEKIESIKELKNKKYEDQVL